MEIENWSLDSINMNLINEKKVWKWIIYLIIIFQKLLSKISKFLLRVLTLNTCILLKTN